MNISESQICSIILTLNDLTGFRYSLRACNKLKCGQIIANIYYNHSFIMKFGQVLLGHKEVTIIITIYNEV